MRIESASRQTHTHIHHTPSSHSTRARFLVPSSLDDVRDDASAGDVLDDMNVRRDAPTPTPTPTAAVTAPALGLDGMGLCICDTRGDDVADPPDDDDDDMDDTGEIGDVVACCSCCRNRSRYDWKWMRGCCVCDAPLTKSCCTGSSCRVSVLCDVGGDAADGVAGLAGVIHGDAVPPHRRDVMCCVCDGGGEGCNGGVCV